MGKKKSNSSKRTEKSAKEFVKQEEQCIEDFNKLKEDKEITPGDKKLQKQMEKLKKDDEEKQIEEKKLTVEKNKQKKKKKSTCKEPLSLNTSKLSVDGKDTQLNESTSSMEGNLKNISLMNTTGNIERNDKKDCSYDKNASSKILYDDKKSCNFKDVKSGDFQDERRNFHKSSNLNSKQNSGYYKPNFDNGRLDNRNRRFNSSEGNWRNPSNKNDKKLPNNINLGYLKSQSDNRNGYGDSEFRKFKALLKSKQWKNTDKIKEKFGDLFDVSNEFSLAHCVAEDLSMGAGIAVEFRRRFKQIGKLCNQNVKEGGVAILQNEERYIYYLITKEKSSGKPTLYTLWKSLIAMREHIIKNNIKKLAMPQIGCGLDRLYWEDVKPMLEYIFQNDDIEIEIYSLTEEQMRSLKLGHKRSKYKNPANRIEKSEEDIFQKFEKQSKRKMKLNEMLEKDNKKTKKGKKYKH